MGLFSAFIGFALLLGGANVCVFVKIKSPVMPKLAVIAVTNIVVIFGALLTIFIFLHYPRAPIAALPKPAPETSQR